MSRLDPGQDGGIEAVKRVLRTHYDTKEVLWHGDEFGPHLGVVCKRRLVDCQLLRGVQEAGWTIVQAGRHSSGKYGFIEIRWEA